MVSKTKGKSDPAAAKPSESGFKGFVYVLKYTNGTKILVEDPADAGKISPTLAGEDATLVPVELVCVTSDRYAVEGDIWYKSHIYVDGAWNLYHRDGFSKEVTAYENLDFGAFVRTATKAEVGASSMTKVVEGLRKCKTVKPPEKFLTSGEVFGTTGKDVEYTGEFYAVCPAEVKRPPGFKDRVIYRCSHLVIDVRTCYRFTRDFCDFVKDGGVPLLTSIVVEKNSMEGAADYWAYTLQAFRKQSGVKKMMKAYDSD